MRKLRPGDLVEVRSKEEILATLDSRARLKNLPFMPEMFQHCGKQFRVYKRAHKACDTATSHGTARWVGDAVHLEGVRCGGEAHGGCQADCMVFWWPEWLKDLSAAAPAGETSAPLTPGSAGCTEQDVIAAAVQSPPDAPEPIYACQATDLNAASTYLPWWNFRQYLADYTSGNTSLWRLFTGFVYISFFHSAKVPYLGRAIEFVYDAFQSLVGGVKFPRKRGKIPPGQKTPVRALDLQPGELVKVRSYEEILDTINDENRNRGLRFDAELVPYCGGTYRVLKRLSRIIDERTGKMMHFKSDSIMLENVFCQGRYSNNRMFCPRAVPCFWKEIWLERADQKPEPAGDKNGDVPLPQVQSPR